MTEKMTKLAIIKKFFGNGNDARPVTTGELKELTPADRQELAELAAVEMGVEIEK